MTTRIEGRPYDDLLVQKGRTGFPSIVMLDEDGEALAIGGARTIEGFEDTLAQAEQMLALAAKAKAGDAAAAKEVFLKRLEWLAIPFADATATLAKLELDDAEQAQAGSWLLQLEMNDARLTKDQQEGLRKLLRIRSEGRLPDDPRIAATFWRMVSVGAERQKDAAAFALYVDYLRAQAEKEPRMKSTLAAAEKKLAALQEG